MNVVFGVAAVLVYLAVVLVRLAWARRRRR